MFNFCIFSTLLDYGPLCFVLYGVHRFFQDCVLILSSLFIVIQSVKSFYFNSILKEVTDFSNTLRSNLSGLLFLNFL